MSTTTTTAANNDDWGTVVDLDVSRCHCDRLAVHIMVCGCAFVRACRLQKACIRPFLQKRLSQRRKKDCESKRSCRQKLQQSRMLLPWVEHSIVREDRKNDDVIIVSGNIPKKSGFGREKNTTTTSST
jgi:hypothetical protein